MTRLLRILGCIGLLCAACGARAQAPDAWRACTGLGDGARLACFDTWARTQAAPAGPGPAAPASSDDDKDDDDGGPNA